ncbi:RNA-binding protein RO60-like [Babylonia areolata]|uniref:RNA-binding protein RO60-like n=1 Tax=Babylonia areolata TaxID=304850 RepID=UPI003FD59CE3
MADTASSLDDFRKLTRFLYFGNGNNLYKAGGAEFQTSLTSESDKARIVHELLAAEKGEQMVEEISKFLNTNKLGTSRGPALFALAICARHADQTHKTKQAAMKVFVSACNSSADLFTFISYAVSVKDTKKGWGRSLKTGVQRWFDNRDAMTLAKIITQQKTGCGWSYVDLLRLTHILPKTEGAKMIAKYLIKGLKAAKEEYGGEKTSSDMQAALAYLGAVEQLKGVTDKDMAAGMVEQHQLHLQQVVARLQQIREVLVALVKQMTLQELLDSMGRLAGYHCLEPTFHAVSDITQRICDPQALQDEHISPISVLIGLRTFENGAMTMKWTRNNSVVEALNSAFDIALRHNVKPTNKRYLVAVNINQQFLSCWVHGAKVLTPIIAAAGLAMVLAHTEESPELVFFDTAVHPLPLTNKMQMPEICDSIMQMVTREHESKRIGDMVAPLRWATSEQKVYDAIIIMTDFRHPRAFTDFPKAFREYKEAKGVPDAKLVMCGLTANHVQFASSEEPGILDIAGFDATVPDLIQHFVTNSL